MMKRALALGLLVCGCSSNTDGDIAVGGADEALSGPTAVSRAMEWVNVKLQYCQSANHATDRDPACSSTCNRQDNAAWDPYRSDCSGLVSWAWGLAPDGRATFQLAPRDNSISHAILASELEPGDALNYWEDHIILFKSWITKGSKAELIEEPGCSGTIHYAHEFPADVSISGSTVNISGYSHAFTAIRYNKIAPPVCKPAPPPPKNQPSGCGGLQIGEGLGEGMGLQSCDGRFNLDMQADGNLVLYWKNHGALWSTGTQYGHNLIMQSDGNFVLYDTCGHAVWSSGTHGHSEAHVDLQGDGNLVIYGGGGDALWSTQTGGH